MLEEQHTVVTGAGVPHAPVSTGLREYEVWFSRTACVTAALPRRAFSPLKVTIPRTPHCSRLPSLLKKALKDNHIDPNTGLVIVSHSGHVNDRKLPKMTGNSNVLCAFDDMHELFADGTSWNDAYKNFGQLLFGLFADHCDNIENDDDGGRTARERFRL